MRIANVITNAIGAKSDVMTTTSTKEQKHVRYREREKGPIRAEYFGHGPVMGPMTLTK